MSKTTEHVIAEQQKARHLAYQNNNPEPTEQEQLDIDLYNFNHAADQIENAIDRFLQVNPDDFNDDNTDKEISLATDYGYQ
jgi:hypothetical protein